MLASNVLSGTIDLTTYEGYENFTKDNFLFVPTAIVACSTERTTAEFNYSYNASTGKLTVTGGGGTSSASIWKCCCYVNV